MNKIIRQAAAALGIFTMLLLSLSLCACSSETPAATVGDVSISEDTITNYVQTYREGNDLADEEAWGEYLSTSGNTPESIRSGSIKFFVYLEAMKKAADEKGVSVSNKDVEDQIKIIKSSYDTEEEFQKAIKALGFSDDTYGDYVRYNLLKDALTPVIASDITADDVTETEICDYINSYCDYFSGMKRYSQIQFGSDQEELAKSVLEQIKNGTMSFGEAAKRYSSLDSASNGGDEGWNALRSSMSDEVYDELNGLKKGEVSSVFSNDGGFAIIKCTDLYTYPGTITQSSMLPKELTDFIKQALVSNKQSEEYDTWMSNYVNQLGVKTSDMPSGLPYDIDMSKYETTSSASGSSSGTGN